MAVREARRKPRADEVIATALVRAAQRLGFSQSELAAVLGTSAASVSRTWNGERPVAPDSAEGRLALLFLRVFRSLDTLVGGDEEKARRWLEARNAHLGGQAPRALLDSTPGLVRVAEYLDAMRGTL
ncbi:MAG TPA: antitoxin Xre/MbcA/ParS toxin-binding domain-containing protein [Myxococcales bacterium]|nr:antitoxin Xre/MbcA/ParS toxin-binding domain-containing protein [Myxococcales bacterium]